MGLHKDETGHWIGDDGFVCPLTFAEFHQRYPGYASMMAKHLRRGADADVIDDLAQDIWHWLLRHRIVERFDPAKVHGCNERRFHYYLKLCLTRMNHTLWKAGTKQPLTASDTMDADAEMGLTEEYIHHKRVHQVVTPDIDDQIFMQQFRAFVGVEEPKLLAVIDALLSNKNNKEAAVELNVKPASVTYYRTRLKRLATKFKHRLPKLP